MGTQAAYKTRAVRDLFGTVHNQGATKGILVTTSGYGKASFDFANNKPLELLSGTNLLYLLKEHAGVNAKIEPPEHWITLRQTPGQRIGMSGHRPRAHR
jgi:restriction endonuclease Mrr